MLTSEQKKQFSDVLEELGKTLDITESQYTNAVKSYEAVGSLLAEDGSSLAPYSPTIMPQGSFMLGTMVKPEVEKDDLDIDVVCQFTGKNAEWTQHDLKQKVGDQIKSNEKYKDMVSEGRRCWTLEYSDAANYHMDILPSLVASGYKIILEKSFSASEVNAIDQLSIRITDNMEANYKTSPHPEQWPKSNPFGFGRWFFYQASLGLKKARSFQESVQPVPSFQKEKLPLQRVVQILKRHRDLMFKGDQDKPVSMIITTLAARAYGQEPYIIEALLNVIQKMPSLIERRYSPKWGREIAWIGNPVNQEENYADKWPDHPQREAKFMKWMNQVSIDVQNAIAQIGIPKIQESLEKPFGKDAIRKAFTRYGEIQQRLRVSGALKMASGSGILSESGQISVKAHTFFGGNE